jgi:hypothetical protein
MVFCAQLADSILCGHWLDDGETNGFELPIVRDCNSFHYCSGGSLYASGLLKILYNLM